MSIKTPSELPHCIPGRGNAAIIQLLHFYTAGTIILGNIWAIILAIILGIILGVQCFVNLTVQIFRPGVAFALEETV